MSKHTTFLNGFILRYTEGQLTAMTAAAELFAGTDFDIDDKKTWPYRFAQLKKELLPEHYRTLVAAYHVHLATHTEHADYPRGLEFGQALTEAYLTTQIHETRPKLRGGDITAAKQTRIYFDHACWAHFSSARYRIHTPTDKDRTEMEFFAFQLLKMLVDDSQLGLPPNALRVGRLPNALRELTHSIATLSSTTENPRNIIAHSLLRVLMLRYLNTVNKAVKTDGGDKVTAPTRTDGQFSTQADARQYLIMKATIEILYQIAITENGTLSEDSVAQHIHGSAHQILYYFSLDRDANVQIERSEAPDSPAEAGGAAGGADITITLPHPLVIPIAYLQYGEGAYNELDTIQIALNLLAACGRYHQQALAKEATREATGSVASIEPKKQKKQGRKATIAKLELLAAQVVDLLQRPAYLQQQLRKTTSQLEARRQAEVDLKVAQLMSNLDTQQLLRAVDATADALNGDVRELHTLLQTLTQAFRQRAESLASRRIEHVTETITRAQLTPAIDNVRKLLDTINADLGRDADATQAIMVLFTELRAAYQAKSALIASASSTSDVDTRGVDAHIDTKIAALRGQGPVGPILIHAASIEALTLERAKRIAADRSSPVDVSDLDRELKDAQELLKQSLIALNLELIQNHIKAAVDGDTCIDHHRVSPAVADLLQSRTESRRRAADTLSEITDTSARIEARVDTLRTLEKQLADLGTIEEINARIIKLSEAQAHAKTQAYAARQLLENGVDLAITEIAQSSRGTATVFGKGSKLLGQLMLLKLAFGYNKQCFFTWELDTSLGKTLSKVDFNAHNLGIEINPNMGEDFAARYVIALAIGIFDSYRSNAGAPFRAANIRKLAAASTINETLIAAMEDLDRVSSTPEHPERTVMATMCDFVDETIETHTSRVATLAHEDTATIASGGFTKAMGFFKSFDQARRAVNKRNIIPVTPLEALRTILEDLRTIQTNVQGAREVLIAEDEVASEAIEAIEEALDNYFDTDSDGGDISDASVASWLIATDKSDIGSVHERRKLTNALEAIDEALTDDAVAIAALMAADEQATRSMLTALNHIKAYLAADTAAAIAEKEFVDAADKFDFKPFGK